LAIFGKIINAVKTAKGKFRISKVLTISFSHFAHDVYTAFLAPLLPILIKTYSLSYTQAGLLNIVRGIPSLFNPLIGAYIDRLGGRRIIIMAPTISAISMTLIGVTPSFGILLILLFIAGVNSTFYHVPSPVIMKQVSGKRSGLGMSFFMLGGETARTLGPVIALAAVSLWGIDGLWKLIPFGLFSSLLLYWRLKNMDIKGLSRNKEAENLSDINTILKKVYKFFLLLSLFLIFRSTVKTALTFFLPTFLKVKGESLWLAGISLSVIELAGMAGTFFGGYISDKIGRKNTMLIASILTPISMFLFLEANTFFKFVLLIILGIVLFSTGSVMLAFVHDIKTDRPAFVNSLYMVASFATSTLSTFGIGKVADNIGLEQTFYWTAFISILAIPVVLMFKEELV
jgi:FSR family fosmidomycin resistance protein-like MFS transporter